MEQAPHWLTHCHNITRQITLPLVPRHRALCSPPPPPMPYCTISVGHNPHDLCSWHTNATSTKHPKPTLTPQQSRLLRSLQSAAILTLWNAFTTRAFGEKPTPTHDEILNQLLGRLLFLRSIDIQLDPLTPWANPQKIQSLIFTAKNRYIPP